MIKIDVEGAEEVLKGLRDTLIMYNPFSVLEIFPENFSKVKTISENSGTGLLSQIIKEYKL